MSVPARRRSSATTPSIERSPAKSVIRCCSVTNPPSSSNQPHPTRNACVPAPPFKPVVSRSKNTNGMVAGDRPTSVAAGEASCSVSANSLTRWRPCKSAGPKRCVTTNERPAAVSRQEPRKVWLKPEIASGPVRLPPSASLAGAFGGGGTPDATSARGVSSEAGLTMPRRRSLSVAMSMSGRQLVREQQVEDAKRSRLRERSGVSDRARRSQGTRSRTHTRQSAVECASRSS